MLGEHQAEVFGFRCQLTSVSGVGYSVTLVYWYIKHRMCLVMNYILITEECCT